MAENRGLLSEESSPVTIHTTPLSDVYDIERTPFARGKYATVRHCRHRQTGEALAAKCLRKRRRATCVRAEVIHEACVLAALRGSPHVVQLRDVYESSSEVSLILELAAGGELQRILDREDDVGELHAARLLQQTLRGLDALHARGIAHLDIKPQNILLTGPFPNCDVVLCDFGISRVISKGIEVREIVGTPDYVAPEILHYNPISLATDMWSIGVLAYVLLSGGHSPFGGDTVQATYCNITQNQLDFPPDLFTGVSAAALSFIRSLLRTNPSDRPTVKQCLEHPWLNPDSSCPRPLAVTQPIVLNGLSSSPLSETKDEENINELTKVPVVANSSSSPNEDNRTSPTKQESDDVSKKSPSTPHTTRTRSMSSPELEDQKFSKRKLEEAGSNPLSSIKSPNICHSVIISQVDCYRDRQRTVVSTQCFANTIVY